MKKILVCMILVLGVTLGIKCSEPKDYKATLKEMLVVSGSDKTFEMVVPQMIEMMKPQLPQVPGEFWEEMEKEMKNTAFNDLVDMLVPIYQEYLTQEDLEEVIKFYQSPAGKKLGSSAPHISMATMQAGQQWGMKLGQKIQAKLQEKGY
ncbi:hypothetical protein CE91St19_24960 [Odoribacter laneus]|jgi:hypothetical protein|uniref:DUF2059 domain-containing protein n=2 Tax=Odoribacter laneus TaxID=626933 RepID=H1DJZ0_9BACT|nr:DUF2059 domain-containing protein [Odoribacter laneus]MBS1445467.1 DUF2059 domain-containing protein [Odoribacter sp.]EHP45990.1 hypothetical protein HMPREF9449_02576 [Odoribacter laneus YIT 12061]CCZ82321.1 putative uncharacterized protein [Odoribacter laneus CAG:561]GKI23094.1 hypothetical protein CE91St19_24960 [Odoribacter laneus]GKI26680.1 hypothetical protein CE91St20_28170 [Odoribacter laneus]